MTTFGIVNGGKILFLPYACLPYCASLVQRGVSIKCMRKANTLIPTHYYIMDTQLKSKINTETRINANLSIWQQIHEDWVAHGRDWTKPGFRAVAVASLWSLANEGSTKVTSSSSKHFI